MDAGAVTTAIGGIIVSIVTTLGIMWKSRTETSAENVQTTLTRLTDRADKQDLRIEKLEKDLESERQLRHASEDENYKLKGVIRDQNEVISDWNLVGDWLDERHISGVPYTWRINQERANHERTLARQREEYND